MATVSVQNLGGEKKKNAEAGFLAAPWMGVRSPSTATCRRVTVGAAAGEASELASTIPLPFLWNKKPDDGEMDF